jgi:hypothetical protein
MQFAVVLGTRHYRAADVAADAGSQAVQQLPLIKGGSFDVSSILLPCLYLAKVSRCARGLLLAFWAI